MAVDLTSLLGGRSKNSDVETKNLHQDVNIPSVSFTNVGVQDSPVAAASTGVLAGMKDVQKILVKRAEDKAAMDAETSARNILLSMNQLVSDEVAGIGKDGKTAAMAIQNVKGNLLEQLANSQVPFKNWGEINTIINSRLDELNKEHISTVDGLTHSFNFATGTSQLLKPPDMNTQEAIRITMEAQMAPEERIWFNSLSPEMQQLTMQNRIYEGLERARNESDMQFMKFKREALSYQKDMREEAQREFGLEFNKKAGSFVTRNFNYWLGEVREGKIDPGKAASILESAFAHYVTENLENIQAAGYDTAGDFKREFDILMQGAFQIFKESHPTAVSNRAGEGLSDLEQQARLAKAKWDILRYGVLSNMTPEELQSKLTVSAERLLMDDVLEGVNDNRGIRRSAMPGREDGGNVTRRTERDKSLTVHTQQLTRWEKDKNYGAIGNALIDTITTIKANPGKHDVDPYLLTEQYKAFKRNEAKYKPEDRAAIERHMIDIINNSKNPAALRKALGISTK